ncbi:cyclic nucleotide-binding domain-containing protein [Bdellovibrio reynosensis]|uniref:Cyclic nucleotide-binding domain-containing protein n=1 Tax=Bdellovibrio reynosensis TaxID=2835041 RepID=A0ABY4CBR5_9BACT|nr:cyclic nucleotide-binding domain-containing protein [Bdellovibrio reynosensis]UOF02406.1 cyclic nucleotide-binding domain-containing protein [Bdellovibrio reynosensis]
MKIEKEQVQLKALQHQPQQYGGVIKILGTNKTYQLQGLQYSYFEVLQTAGSIEGVVNFFMGQGWLISFRELWTLIDFLVDEDILLNPSIRSYFSKKEISGVHFQHSLTFSPGQAKIPSASSLPFFRSLEPQLAQYLLQKAECLKVPAGVRLIQAGNKDRDLYILLQGGAAVYKVYDEKRRQLVSSLGAGAICGERGFLLNQARTADVVTTAPCEVLRVKHLPDFDQLIKSDKAHSLQHRFWVLQALQSSNFFKDFPGDSLDSLIFSGKLCQAAANQVLFQEGQPGTTCYILVQGNVVISQRGHNINVLNQGSCFGEISLLMSSGKRTATIKTQQDSILLEIQQQDFYRILSQNLFLAKELENLAAQRLMNDQKRN